MKKHKHQKHKGRTHKIENTLSIKYMNSKSRKQDPHKHKLYANTP